MKAAVLHGHRDLRVEERALPQLTPGSVLLRVDACAICGSDIRTFNHGNNRVVGPSVIGHEIAGTVVGVGEGVTRFQLGDRLSVGGDVPCGKCVHCLSGSGNNCDINLAIGYQFDGGFAEYLRLDPLVVEHGPIQKYYGDLTASEACLAEPLACCINGFEVANMREGCSVAVFGAGPIGLMLIALAKAQYKSMLIISIDPNPSRRKFAMKCGADFVIDPTQEDPATELMRISEGRGIERIFTACSIPETHEQAFRSVAKRGFINLFGGLPAGSSPVKLDSNWIHYREAYITGSHGATPKHHSEAIRLIENKKIRMDIFISNELPLTRIADAFALAESGSAVKVVITPAPETLGG